jgi:very-short-patch-repair endonuclease
MKKEQFKELNKTEIYCNCCNRILPKENFSYSYVHLDGTASRCKSCDWFKRRGKISLPKWSEQEIHRLVDFIIFEESHILNDLLMDLNDKTIEDLIHGFQSIKIGNKPIKVKSICKNCGVDVLKSPSAYLNTDNNYCSSECYWNDKPNTVGRGEYNYNYKRIKTTCTNCNKEIEVIPFDFNKKNEYGDNHNFCCQECYWEYRSKYYIGEKSVGANRIFTDEMLEKMRITCINNSRNSKRFDSKIQLIINDVLDSIEVKYKREHIIKYYAVDNYLIDSGLIIEVMGDYWHTNKRKYNNNKYMINEMQVKGIRQDKAKHTYIKSHNGVEVLYLWEYDIEHNIETCKKLILEYIKKNGELKNYHSFNYSVDKNNKLIINKDTVIPYQDMEINEYRNLVKYKNIG